MRSLYPVTTIVSLLFVHGAVAGESSLWSTDWLFGRSAETTEPAQLAEAKQRKAPAEPVQPSQDKTASPQQGSESRPAERTETTNFENWILSCREFVEGPKKRSCAMTVAVHKADTNRIVLSWTVRQTEKGLVSVIETLPGISITPGIQLKLENGPAERKIPIEVCEPNWCSGSLPMDKAFIQEVSSSSKVTVVVTSSAGQPFTFELPIKGFEKAYAKM